MHFREHLYGDQEIGTYPVLDNCTARWGCIDIDDDNYDKALEVQQVWDFFHVPSWIERSRSKGFHVWTFCEQWTPAAVLREAGLYVAYLAKLPRNIEVNPKQASVLDLPKPKGAPAWIRHGIGNTVRLPYSAQAKPGRMAFCGPGGEPMDVGVAVALASQHRASQGPLRRAAALWSIELRRRARAEADARQQIKVRSSLSPSSQDAWRIVAGLRTVGSGERDNQFFTIAKMLHAQGTEFEVAMRVVEEAYWNQVEDKQGFSLADALRKVERVYGT